MYKILTPPTFPDSERTRKARVFFNLVVGSALIVTAAEIIECIVLPHNILRWLFNIGIFDFLSVGWLFLNRKGYTRIASILLVATCMLLSFILASSAGGIRAPAIQNILIIVLAAGLILGWKQGFLAGLVAILGSLGFVLAENWGIMPVSTVAHNSLSLWINFVICIGLLALLQYLSVANLDKALHEAQQELRLRTQVEETLRESERKFRNLFDNAIEGVFHTTSDGRLISVNRALAKMLGYESPEKAITAVTDIARQLYANANDRNIAIGILKENGFLKEFETQMRKQNGGVAWVSINARLNKSPDGNTSFEGFITDITKRKQVEETLRASEERFRRMFEHSALGMVLVSPDLCFLQANQAFSKMLGYTESELQEKTFQDVTLPEDRSIGNELVYKVLSGELESFHFEKRYVRKDGTVIWGLVSSTLIRDIQGKPLHFVTQIQNINERKRAEEERAKLQDQLIQSQKMESVGRLAGGVAHDFNNMLSVILGYTELALNQVDPDNPLFAELHEIREAAGRSAESDSAAAGLCAQADHSAPSARPESNRGRHTQDAPAAHRRGYRPCLAAQHGVVAGQHGPFPDRPDSGQPVRQCPGRHRRERHDHDRDRHDNP